MSNDAVQGTGAYLTLAVESLESQLTAAETTMREVAEELRKGAALARTGEGSPGWQKLANGLDAYADLLDPPPVVENPPA